MLGPHNTLMWSVYLTSSAILFEEEKKKCKFSRFAHILFTGLFGSLKHANNYPGVYSQLHKTAYNHLICEFENVLRDAGVSAIPT